MAQLRAPVTAAPARPPVYGLIAAAPIIEDPELRWVGGWSYQPEGCGLSGIDSPACAGNVGVMEVPAGPASVTGDPVWVWAGDECSTFGFDARDWQGRARRQLAANESYLLARELWDGAVSNADSLDNRWLAEAGASSDTVTGGATNEVGALACVESALLSATRGQPGMVHMTTQLLTHLSATTAVYRQGLLWLTAMGNVVVADAGYSGNGPGGEVAGESQWMYGTPLLRVRLGPVDMVPGSLEDARSMAAAMDRAVNNVVVVAGRMAGVQWDSECAHVAGEVDLAVCLVGGAS